MSAVLNTIISVVIVSLVSLVGIFSILLRKKNTQNFLLLLVSLSAGTLFGGAFLHLLPEVVADHGFTIQISLLVLAGVMTFFVLEKFIHWGHCHHHPAFDFLHSHHATDKNHHDHKKKNDKSQIAVLNLLADGVHNFLDGLVIAGSYLVSPAAGIATTIAVIIHEVPQEIADFGVLLYAGLSKKRALLLNFGSAAISILGAVIGLWFGSKSDLFIPLILPFAAGGFLYIAGSNLVPELHKKCDVAIESFWHFVMMVLGIGLMYGLTFIG
ncbi:ZIP family metal transporter [Candidatus Woesearchaeota archaeon]|jgi:zinc and cadmium transporter|nr:ZIP family metal transporter [Candidatus Woesearchaeota archaeon]MBT4150437.1 ZIP family metal transporter [Candidatus Woesearchaeota archaeon]MBT4247488.1 ZIP family metal transporter [Candidatus Woesearchaeota archaeon]MBT4434473.1 ZIP family metal transporter [Candidatus Woesearchaeota archaeon]MBT7331673.1 ZIP family metal transporter [Candidatus Woesearchaeota archaeon]